MKGNFNRFNKSSSIAKNKDQKAMSFNEIITNALKKNI